MFCKNCGKEINDNAYVCPYCGVKVSAGGKSESNTLAIVGFIMSFLFSIVGLILSILGYKKSAELGGEGKSMATAGIIISAVSIGLAVSMFVIAFVSASSILW